MLRVVLLTNSYIDTTMGVYYYFYNVEKRAWNYAGIDRNGGLSWYPKFDRWIEDDAPVLFEEVIGSNLSWKNDTHFFAIPDCNFSAVCEYIKKVEFKYTYMQQKKIFI